MAKLLKKEFLILLLFIAVFILLRSINFVWYLNFSGDQATFSTKTLEIYRTHKPVLIGPPISINLGGRRIFQGPMIYYELLFFLFLGHFDPISSSYIYMVFCALMIIPLYYGAKLLLNQRAAFIMVAIYALLPYYIDFTRFLWNPTFQFSLVPLLILLMGLYQQKKNNWIFLGVSVLLGIMLQYHYQFVLVILGLFFYYLLFVKVKPKQVVLYFLGILIGFSPVILFEIRNHFYNIQTIILFVKNYSKLDKPGGNNRGHYFLSISFMTIMLLLGLFKQKLAKIKQKKFKAFYLPLVLAVVIWDVFIYSPKPKTAFWSASENWNYPAEDRVYQLIKKENRKDYNVSNLAYDTLATVPKYLLKRDSVQINYDDYYHNHYLFVIEEKKKKNFMDDPAYEVASFRPFKLLGTWKINDYYNMYLVERGSSK